MKAFRVIGEFRMGDFDQRFAKEVIAKDEKAAVEFIYSIFGSRHGVRRGLIKIERAVELKPAEIEDPVVKQRLQGARK